MKLAFIVCYEHVKPSLMDMLRALRIDYYTHWEQIKGKGHGTEPHVGTGSYVRMNDALMIAFEDEAPLAELILPELKSWKSTYWKLRRRDSFDFPVLGVATWLRTDLAANTNRWTIAYWHHPPYSKGTHDSDSIYETELSEMRQNFNPILEAGGVQCGFCTPGMILGAKVTF